MNSNAIPSVDPANLNSLQGTFNETLKKWTQAMAGALPASIISYDRTTNLAQVQPLIMLITTNNTQVARAPIASVPVYQIGGGGALLNFNLVPGDLGWIKANDRDISLFKNNFKQSPPGTFRLKDYGDVVFYPHKMTGYTIAEEDANNTVLQTADGTVKISLGTNEITISAPTINLNTENLVTNSSADFTIDAENMTITLSADSSTAAVNSTVTLSGDSTTTAQNFSATVAIQTLFVTPKFKVQGAFELLASINQALLAIKAGNTVTGGPFDAPTQANIQTAINQIATFI